MDRYDSDNPEFVALVADVMAAEGLPIQLAIGKAYNLLRVWDLCPPARDETRWGLTLDGLTFDATPILAA